MGVVFNALFFNGLARRRDSSGPGAVAKTGRSGREIRTPSGRGSPVAPSTGPVIGRPSAVYVPASAVLPCGLRHRCRRESSQPFRLPRARRDVQRGPRSVRDMTTTADVLILGLGAAGAAA